MRAPSFSPRLAKAALIVLDPLGSRKTIAFQYNPETLTRRLEARAAGQNDNDRWGPTRLSQPPRETITITVELDASDGLEGSHPAAVTSGVHPALAALELLLYPELTEVQANAALASLGTIEIVPALAPLLLFAWGERRVLPVKLSSLSVVEDAHDTRLNPTHAKVELSMAVLTYGDVNSQHPAYGLSIAHQVIKEALALTRFPLPS
jgi:hypothetical protein